ncbi:MAG: FapA family protein [Planctomycetota bacterium]|nr:FapA family protein [Planctomycetota bacterium]
MSAPDATPPPDHAAGTPPAGGSAAADNLVRLTIAADQSAAIVFIGSGASPDSVSLMALTALVEERGLARTPELAAAIKSLAEDCARAPGKEFERVVAKGKPVVHGIDGRLELDPKFDPEHRAAAAEAAAKAAQADANARIDHHARSVFVSAKRGDVLGRVVPPTIGREGIDVFGRSLNPRDARAFKLLHDDTIALAPDGTITAHADGMLVRNGNTLRVSPKLNVPDAVDFTTGNVDFPGEVVINRGVRDCFRVHAGRTLLIRGLVEAAELSADLDITLEGGMAGRQKGTLRAKRDAAALYLEQVTAHVGRDLRVGKEATHCHLNVGRAIIAPTAALIGGDICVAGHVEVAQIGTDANAPTRLAVGHLPETDAKLHAAASLVERLNAKRQEALDKLKQLQSATGKLTASQAEELTEREFEAAEYERQAKQVRAAICRILSMLEAAGRPCVTVLSELWPGSKLWIGPFVCEPRQVIRGPLKIWVNERGEPQLTLKTTGATSALSTVCRVMRDDRFVDRAEIGALAGHVTAPNAFSDAGEQPGTAAHAA